MSLLSTRAPLATVRDVQTCIGSQRLRRHLAMKIAALEPVLESEDEESTDAGSAYASESEWQCSSASEDEGTSREGLLRVRPAFRAPPGLSLGLRASHRARNQKSFVFRTSLETIPGSPATRFTGTTESGNTKQRLGMSLADAGGDEKDNLVSLVHSGVVPSDVGMMPHSAGRPVFTYGKVRTTAPASRPVLAYGKSKATNRSCTTRRPAFAYGASKTGSPPALGYGPSSLRSTNTCNSADASVRPKQEPTLPANKFTSFAEFARAVTVAQESSQEMLVKLQESPFSYEVSTPLATIERVAPR